MNENRFDGKAHCYASYRPGYPEALMDDLFSKKVLAPHSVVADVGMGTGIFAKQLLERGCAVYGVEPNADMLLAASYLLENPRFTAISASAEAVPLPDGSLDCITAAQSFHWFSPDAFRRECARLLKPGGKVCLVWNTRREGDPLIQACDKLLYKYCPNFVGSTHGGRGSAPERLATFFDGVYTTAVFPNPVIYSRGQFVGRQLSGSYALEENDARYPAFVHALGALFDAFSVKDNGESVVFAQDTQCFTGNVRAE